MADLTTPQRRAARLADYEAEYGEPAYPRDWPAEVTDAGRVLLVEEGPDGYFLTTHETAVTAVRYNRQQEYASDWAIVALVDLDSGETFDERDFTVTTTVERAYTCGTCGHRWSYETPAARCPRELHHDDPEDETRPPALPLLVDELAELVARLDHDECGCAEGALAPWNGGTYVQACDDCRRFADDDDAAAHLAARLALNVRRMFDDETRAYWHPFLTRPGAPDDHDEVDA